MLGIIRNISLSTKQSNSNSSFFPQSQQFPEIAKKRTST